MEKSNVGIGKLFFIGLLSYISLINLVKADSLKSNGDNSPVIRSTNGDITINYSINSKKTSKNRPLLELISLGSDKKYIESILGVGKKYNEEYRYIKKDYIFLVYYRKNIAVNITFRPLNESYAKSINIQRFTRYYDKEFVPFLDATLGSFIRDGELTDIDANVAGAGNMNCVNYANYTFKLKPHPMSTYQVITVGYQGSPCSDNNTGVDYFFYYDQENILSEGVNSKNIIDLKKIKINYITIGSTDKT